MTRTPEMLVSHLGDHLMQQGLITAAQREAALAEQRAEEAAGRNRPLVGQILVRIGAIDQATLDRVITEQILALRNALEEANRILEKTVAERTAQLELSLATLENLNKLQIRFVANLSHELRTPLFHITGNLELISDGDLGPVTSEQRQAVATAQRAADRLGFLIEDLILFTSTRDGPLQLRLQPLSVPPLGEAATTYLQTAARSAGLQVQLDCPPMDAWIRGNAERLAWVLRQLIDNAVKFTARGGSISLRIQDAGDDIRFAVEDTGIGIPGTRIEEIFDPFHQLDEAVNRSYGGVGLGLTLVRRILQAHGTEICVASEVGRGSVFSFHLAKDSLPVD